MQGCWMGRADQEKISEGMRRGDGVWKAQM